MTTMLKIFFLTVVTVSTLCVLFVYNKNDKQSIVCLNNWEYQLANGKLFPIKQSDYCK
jgi:hypothetical protein